MKSKDKTILVFVGISVVFTMLIGFGVIALILGGLYSDLGYMIEKREYYKFQEVAEYRLGQASDINVDLWLYAEQVEETTLVPIFYGVHTYKGQYRAEVHIRSFVPEDVFQNYRVSYMVNGDSVKQNYLDTIQVEREYSFSGSPKVPAYKGIEFGFLTPLEWNREQVSSMELVFDVFREGKLVQVIKRVDLKPVVRIRNEDWFTALMGV
jgi:hypothetical protein